MMTNAEKGPLGRAGSVVVPLLAAVTVMSIVSFETLFPILARLLAMVVLTVVAWASWTGFRQNRGRNREWPINLAVLAVSALAAVGVLVSAFD